MSQESRLQQGSSPMVDSQVRLDQLRRGGAWIHSAGHVLDLLRNGTVPPFERTLTEEELQNGEHELKSKQFYAATMAVYGEIILAATNMFGKDFVDRASEDKLTAGELSGVYEPDNVHAVQMNAGGARG